MHFGLSSLADLGTLRPLPFFFSFFFLPHRAVCRISVPQPGIEPAPPTVAAQSLNHWTAREVPGPFHPVKDSCCSIDIKLCCVWLVSSGPMQGIRSPSSFYLVAPRMPLVSLALALLLRHLPEVSRVVTSCCLFCFTSHLTDKQERKKWKWKDLSFTELLLCAKTSGTFLLFIFNSCHFCFCFGS